MYTCPRCGDEPLELGNYHYESAHDWCFFRYALCPTCDWNGSAMFNGNPLMNVEFLGFRDYDLSEDIQMLPEEVSRPLKVARRLERSQRSRRK